MTTVQETVKTIGVDSIEPLRADVALVRDCLQSAGQTHIRKERIFEIKSREAMFRLNRQPRPAQTITRQTVLVGYFPSPIGLLEYRKELYGDSSRDSASEPEEDLVVWKRTFIFIPSKWIRLLGAKLASLITVISRNPDLPNWTFFPGRKFDTRYMEVLGFYRGPRGFIMKEPDFHSLKRLLSEGKISANDRADRWGSSLLEVSIEHGSFDARCLRHSYSV